MLKINNNIIKPTGSATNTPLLPANEMPVKETPRSPHLEATLEVSSQT
jgi:hypothetical protein